MAAVPTSDLESSGGIGAVMLAPPALVTTFEVTDGADLIEATADILAADDDNPLAGVGMFSLVVRPAARPVADVMADARAAAAAADVAVVVVGLTEEQETEAVDKATIALTGDQDALVDAVAEAARRTVVVVNSATPVLMPWADQVDAILWAGLPGQEGGHAVAAALLGEIEPAGRLVTTFPAADGAAPAWEVVPTDGDLRYDEGTAIGYRGHFAGQAPAPAFWLGHGLGYATWEYSAASILRGWPAGFRRSGRRGHGDQHRIAGQPRGRPDLLSTGRNGAARTPGGLDCGRGRGRRVDCGSGHHRRPAVAALGYDGQRLGAPLTGGDLLIARGARGHPG